MRPDSRYASADSVFVSGHLYDEGGVVTPREESTEAAVRTRETLYRLRARCHRTAQLPLPEPPDTTYMAKVTDSFPLLAKRLLHDSEQWWVLAEANPQVRHPLDLKTADVLYIPS